MALPSPKARASEIQSDGPATAITGMEQASLAEVAGAQAVHSPSLAVNTAATGHFVVPFKARIVSGVMRTITQQTSADGSAVIEKNGSTIGTLSVATAGTAGTLTNVTVGASDTITAANANLERGDLITFSRPNTGATGVVAMSLVIVPRQ